MNTLLPPFSPPSRHGQEAPRRLPDKVRYLDDFITRYTDYVVNYFQQVIAVLNTGAQGYATSNVASAATINISAYTTIVTGTTAVDTINTTPGFSGQIHIIAQDGFATTTAGNISAVVTLGAGQSALFDYNPVNSKWYPNLGA
jgi:hypothetical protein